MTIVRALALVPILMLIGCGAGPEPKVLEGEDQAAVVVTSFLRAIEAEDYVEAAKFLYPKPDYILKDLAHCRDLFYSAPPSGMSVMSVGHEQYGHEWQIYVDLKLSYGTKMKQLHFVLAPDTPPLLRSVNPIVPNQ